MSRFVRRALQPRGLTAVRRMDIHEDPKNNVVEATFELPGLKKEDVNIEVHNNRLTVSGETKQETDREDSGYVTRERRRGRFSRTIQLPSGIKPEDVKANMDNGVLKVTFPRTSPEAAPKRVTVS
ncbi:HSP20-like chaperone [Obba rivulosa]|uniref:HSP20-like chaperone n=1 Tax=Obba rivulosa TaxID=1052685 RepID=A0A8E2AWG5_9APHY|nr:HSP20-like chaperone [Obba rivulosa]